MNLFTKFAATAVMSIAGASAFAIPITGTIDFTGDTAITANQVTFPGDERVDSGTGAYAGVTNGTPVTFTNFSYNPFVGPVAPLWTFNFGGNTYSFNLMTATSSEAGGFFNLSGTGMLSITGGVYDATPGTFFYSSQGTRASFSAQNVATSVPEPATLGLLGLGLLGVGMARRRRSKA
jgi:hypothetical protein